MITKGTPRVKASFLRPSLPTLPLYLRYARLVAAIRALRTKTKEHSEFGYFGAVDAGDWFSGTVFTRLGPEAHVAAVPELQLFHEAGYTAITLGNHDFDLTPRVLASMLQQARDLDLQVPIVASNLHPEGTLLAPLYGSAPHTGVPDGSAVRIAPYKVEAVPTRDGREARICYMGLFGPDASVCSPISRRNVGFTGYDNVTGTKNEPEFFSHAAAFARDLKDRERCDVLVAMLHGGRENMEDVNLAHHAPEIDVIFAGHTHETYYHPVIHKSVFFFVCV